MSIIINNNDCVVTSLLLRSRGHVTRHFNGLWRGSSLAPVRTSRAGGCALLPSAGKLA